MSVGLIPPWRRKRRTNRRYFADYGYVSLFALDEEKPALQLARFRCITFLGVNPQEKREVLARAKQCECENIHLVLNSVADDFERNCPCVRLIKPPVMIPNVSARRKRTPLAYRFFRHYRKGEKSIRVFA